MSGNLQKGQKISLTKEGGGLKKVMVGLGWDEAQPQGKGLMRLFAAKPADIDCDASVILCGENGKTVGTSVKDCCVYFGNLRHSGGDHPAGAAPGRPEIHKDGNGGTEHFLLKILLCNGNFCHIGSPFCVLKMFPRHNSRGKLKN